jgi:hypothetical protein
MIAGQFFPPEKAVEIRTAAGPPRVNPRARSMRISQPRTAKNISTSEEMDSGRDDESTHDDRQKDHLTGYAHECTEKPDAE